ncbi:hypothetical protein B0H16DRAFT_1715774 [Mycena metata]|uniref:Uncharacterized protein n=1 Tax=Mycena metata TaxID=1033252 RepID=A0AAD7JPK7_9AGAR|nr:hypothetical protein B0H16DRAFT_1715774 [Mycena metata]
MSRLEPEATEKMAMGGAGLAGCGYPKARSIEVPECEPLVHIDAVPDSLDTPLPPTPPPTRTLPTHPYHLRIRGPHPTFAHPPWPIKVRSRGPSPPTSLNLQPPPLSQIGQSVRSGAATPTTSSTTTTTNITGATTSAMLALIVVAALLVTALVDYLFFAPPFSALRCNNLHPLAHITALAGFPSRFTREGPGFVYVLGLVDDWNLGDWHTHHIGNSQFLNHFQSHFWLWSFRVRNHMVVERLCHTLLAIEDNNNHAAFQCPAPLCDTRHQEFWWLRRHGGFLKV